MNKPTHLEEMVYNEKVELSLPLNGAYISAARLTTSSIANRLHFSADEMEDMRAAVSEACTFVIKNAKESAQLFKVVFSIGQAQLHVTITCQGTVSTMETPSIDKWFSHESLPSEPKTVQKNSPHDDAIQLLMIKSLMDSMDIQNNADGTFTIKMHKKHVPILFNA